MSSRIVRWSEADGDVEAFARRLRTEHPGDVLDVSQPELAAALDAAGASLGRRSLLMGRDLRPLPVQEGGPDRAPVMVGPMRREPERYAAALLHAFPPDHADFDPAISDEAGAVRALRSYFAGDVIGPFVAEGSCEAVIDDEVAGGMVISAMPEREGHDGGPWVTEVFVLPAFQGRGIGGALFAFTFDALRGAGHTSLGLAVHADNPAQALYRRLGFVERSRWTRITV